MPPAANPVAHRALATALRWYEEGRIADAEPLCRQLILLGHASPVAWNLVGRAMASVARHAHAAAAFEAALELDPRFKPARKNLHAAQAALASGLKGHDDAPPDHRFLLIHAFGAGFWADVDHVLGALLVAEITNRTPIIHWGPSSRYTSNPAVNAWPDFFEPVNAFTLDHVRGKGLACFPPKWNDANLLVREVNKMRGPGSRLQGLNFLNRPEPLLVSDWHISVPQALEWLPEGHPLRGMGLRNPGVPCAPAYRALVRKYLNPHAQIRAAVDEFHAQTIAGRPVLGVHVRGTDKVLELPWIAQVEQQYAPEIDTRLQRLGPDAAILLITDSAPAFVDYKTRFGQRLISPAAIRGWDTVGLHFSAFTDRRRLGAEVIRDVLLGARCDEFVGLGWSNVTNFVNYFKEWPPGAWIALGAAGHGHYSEIPP